MIGIFLGAGASYEVGMPIVTELTSSIRKNLIPRLDSRLFNFEKIPHIRQQLADLLNDDRYNYEQVLSELEKTYMAERKNAQAVWGVIIQFIECIQLLLLEDQAKTIHFFKRKVRDYSAIKTITKIHYPLNIFSLNHDIVFEEICDHFQIPLKDGFYTRTNQYENIANFKTLTTKEIENETFDFFEGNEGGVNLLKLHGSIDIFAANDKDLFLKSYGSNDQFGSHYSEIKKIEDHSLKIADDHNLRTVNELQVYDKRHKLQFLRRSLLSGGHKFTGSMTQIIPIKFLNVFKKRLDSIDCLNFIGYGFGDQHINLIVEEWLNQENKQAIIYDPYRSDIPACFKKQSNKVTLIKGGLTDFMNQYAPQSLSAKASNHINILIRNNLKKKREK